MAAAAVVERKVARGGGGIRRREGWEAEQSAHTQTHSLAHTHAHIHIHTRCRHRQEAVPRCPERHLSVAEVLQACRRLNGSTAKIAVVDRAREATRTGSSKTSPRSSNGTSAVAPSGADGRRAAAAGGGRTSSAASESGDNGDSSRNGGSNGSGAGAGAGGGGSSGSSGRSSPDTAESSHALKNVASALHVHQTQSLALHPSRRGCCLVSKNAFSYASCVVDRSPRPPPPRWLPSVGNLLLAGRGCCR
jgi:hypothetical protein